MKELYGIVGLPEDRTITGGLTPQTIQGYSALGRQATNPQFQNPFVTNPRLTYTLTLGRQTLKLGAEILAINTDAQAPIFRTATWGILGDAFEVVSEMIRHLKGEHGQGHHRTRELK